MAIFVLFLISSMGAALLFMADSDVKMNKAGLRAKAAFFEAEAGLENARNVLRLQNIASANPSGYSDELLVAAGSGGAIQVDPATIAPVYNSAGQVTGFTGYGNDVPLVAFTAFSGGWHAAFLTNDPIDGRTNTTDTNDRLMITSIGATSDRSVEVIQAIIEPQIFPSLPATITMLGPTPADFTGGSSGAKNYDGDDCDGAGGYTGIPGLHMPVVGGIGSASDAFIANELATKGGTYNSGGNTGSNTVRRLDVDRRSALEHPHQSSVDQLRGCPDARLSGEERGGLRLHDRVAVLALELVDDLARSPTSRATSISVRAMTGRGILWVTGSLTLRGNTSWEGPIIVAGKGDFERNGGGNGNTWGGIVVANIAGADGVYGTGDDCTGGTGGFLPAIFHTNGGGNHDTVYCSDAINQALNGLPLKVLDFRQR